ncbi:MAG: hypothetical protein KJ072_18875 [Verrucomicrobia bacterium]|nr:hypothetical protein [Verrucomicrobiota bacterium]
MQTRPPSNRPNQRASLAAWLASLLGAAVLAALAAVAGVWTMLHASREVATLRDCVLTSTVADGRKEIEFSVGPLVLGLARAGLNWVELEPEVRSLLGAVRGTSVGVYRLDQAALDRPSLIERVDDVMSRRGWERMLGVLDGNNCVLAYVPTNLRSPHDLRLSLVVLDGRQLVVASVRADPEPVMELLLREARQAGRSPRRSPRASAPAQGLTIKLLPAPWVRAKS